MQIYNEKREFKTKDELLRTVIREEFDKTDISGCDEWIELAINYQYDDLAKEMQSDLNTEISYQRMKNAEKYEAEGERMYEVSRGN